MGAANLEPTRSPRRRAQSQLPPDWRRFRRAFQSPNVFDEICLQSFEAALCVLGVAQFLVPLPVGHLDRIYAVRDVGKNARNIDTAFADVKARVPHDAYHLGTPRRYLDMGIAEMGEMEPFARHCVEVRRVV